MFYDNLALACKESNLKIATIVKECGGAVGSIDGWKKGAIPRSDIVAKLALRLNVSTDYLILGNNSKVKLSKQEKELLNYFSSLSDEDKGRILGKAETLAEIAAERAAEQAKPDELTADERPSPAEPKTCTIIYYDYPASAGTGLFLDETIGEEISVVQTPEVHRADFAIPIKGDSMEPDFSDGDVVFVESCPCVTRGEVGIFVVDGEAFIKQFGGDCLISSNKQYEPRMFKDHTSIVCLGRVLGKAETVK